MANKRKAARPIDYVLEECILILRANQFGVIDAPDGDTRSLYLQDNIRKTFHLVKKSDLLSWIGDAQARGRIVHSGYAS